MKNNKKILFIVIIICLSFILLAFGCNPAVQLKYSNQTSTQIYPTKLVLTSENNLIQKTLSLASLQSSTPFVYETSPVEESSLIPTLNPFEQEEKIKILLHIDQTCLSPCIMGIVPGETKWKEIEKSFTEYGFYWSKPFTTADSEGKILYTYMGSVFSPYTLGISTYVIEDIVDGLSIGLSGPGILDSIPDFYLNNIIHYLGIPSRIWVDSDYREGLPRPVFSFWVFYDLKGIAIQYYVIGSIEENTIVICPNDPNHFEKNNNNKLYGENLFIQNPENPRNLEKLIELWGQKIPNLPYEIPEITGYSFETVSGLKNDDYYLMFSDNSQQKCVKVDSGIWGGK